jgi:tRNA 2-thiouridine synthesizing protein C
MDANKVIMLMRKAPYGSVYTAEGFRTVMGIAVFELPIDIVFVDDGVFALAKNQNPAQLDMKPLGDGFPTLGDFGVKGFYVHAESLAERGLTPADLVMDVQVVDSRQVAEILEGAAKVLPF